MGNSPADIPYHGAECLCDECWGPVPRWQELLTEIVMVGFAPRGETMQTHVLKCWPIYFKSLLDGTKTFEVRKNDRDYQVGDTLHLMEFEPCPNCKGTGRVPDNNDFVDCSPCPEDHGTYVEDSPELFFKVTYITSFGQQEGHIVMGLDQIAPGSNLVQHAERELTLMGYDPEDTEEGPNRWIRGCLIELIKTFVLQGHSGATAPYCLGLFKRLAAFEPLMPLTGEDDEWEDVSQYGDPSVQWQNRRCSSVLKGPDGIAFDMMRKIYVLPDGTTRPCREARNLPVEFPYMPEAEMVTITEQDLADTMPPTPEEAGG